MSHAKASIAALLLPLLLTMALSPGPLGAATDSPRRVLLLDSYGRNVAPISTVLSVLRTELSSRSPEPIDLHEVSLEMARFAQSGQEPPFVNFLRERFSLHKPNLVVSAGGPAFSFLQRNRDLFPNVPIVIAGVAEQILKSGPLPPGSVATPVAVDIRESIEDLLTVLPGTTRIEVILGTSPIEAFWREEFRKVSAALSGRAQLNFSGDLPFDAIRRRLAELPAGSAVLYGMLLMDGAGVPHDPSEALKALAGSANAPVFALNETYLGLGIVGGRLIADRAAGMQAAEVAWSILNGATPAGLGPGSPPPAVPLYDWRVLQRWRIPEARLPQSSVVLYRQPTLWESYRSYLVLAATALIVQGGLIAGLLVQRRRRARAERGLQQSESRLRLITDSLPVLIAYVDGDQRYRFANAAYVKWFGRAPQEILGRKIPEVVGDAFYRAIRPHLMRVLSGEHVRYALDTQLPNGNPISIEAIYVPEWGDQGAVCGFYAMVMDVTERNNAQQESRRLQDELSHASRITTTGELAGTLAHEINQPLAAIMSNAQAARRFLDSPAPDVEEVREILSDIVAEDARAGEVINRLRAFLKKSRAVLEPVDLNAVFGEVVGFVRSDAVVRDATLSLDLDPALPKVIGDRIQLQQVVLNLVLNAFDAVDARPRGERRILLRTGRENGLVHAAVSDSGNGIPAEEFETVFTPFFTTKPQGLGMGLPISRSIIARHQGRIWVEAVPDGGACFRFCLPAAPETDRAGAP